jgi:hypothetical protein
MFCFLFTFSCTENRNERKKVSGNADVNNIASEDSANAIPLFQRGYFIKPDKTNKAVALDNISKGYDSLQLRLWIVNGLFSHRRLYVIKNSSGKWESHYYELSLDSNYANGNGTKEFLAGPEPFDLKVSKTVIPKLGWSRFIDSIRSLKIFELNDMSELKDAEVKWTHPTAYIIEIASKKYYRNYTLYDPHRFIDKLWQADNMQRFEYLLYEQFMKQFFSLPLLVFPLKICTQLLLRLLTNNEIKEHQLNLI